ncbi:PleD family two-component system response regulator [Nocardia sp. NPDC101769]|uniref:response regulator n=1 Tax=Nocardia sp. NPDC101769 TaxID=3364333 RepID=UPI00382F465B
MSSFPTSASEISRPRSRPGEHPPPPATILVVESNPAAAEILVLVLATAGYQAISTATGQRALSTRAKLTPNLVVVGPSRADMRPAQLCRALRARTDAPILVLSSDIDTGTVEPVVAGGASECLLIPISARDLLTHITALLGSSHGREQAAIAV